MNARDLPMRISAKADYALRATAELAAAGRGVLVKGDRIAQAQGIPLKFLLNILTDLRHARLVRSHRGSDGGFELAMAPEDITVADVIEAVEGSLSTVQDVQAEDLAYLGPAEGLRDVWMAVASTLRSVLGAVTLADLASGDLPPSVRLLVEEPLPA